MKDAAHELVAEFLGFEGIKSILEQTWESLEKGVEAIKNFHKSAAGAESQPRYLGHTDEFEKRSTALSTAYGMDVNQVVNPLRDKIATDVPFNTPDQIVRQIRGNRPEHIQVHGPVPQDVFSAEKKLRETYSNLGVGQAEDAVELFRERGGMKADELNQFLDTTLSGFQLNKTPLRDVETLGTVASAPEPSISRPSKTCCSNSPI